MKRFFFILFCFFLNIACAEEDLSVQKNLASMIHPVGEAKAGYITLPKDKGIDNSTYLYVKYALDYFIQERVDFVLLDLDTPGGEVFAALRIVEELRKIDTDHKIPVIAFVDNWALSAGALLAYSCRFIGATDQASMGAAEPVVVSSGGGMETASEKMISALRTEFAKTAKVFGRNPAIAEAMVDRDVILVERQGQLIGLVSEEQMEKEDVIFKAKGKLLTLDAEQMKKWSVADFVVQTGGEPLTGEKTLSKEPFFSFPITWFSYSNWKIDFFSFLSHPFISSLFVMGLMIGFYGVIQNPTFGFSAVLAIFSLGFILLSTFATQVVGFLELIFFLAGLLLFILDVFFIGFGFIGGVGILLAFIGLFAMLLPSLQGVSFSFDSAHFGIILGEWLYRLSLLLLSFLLSLVVASFFSRWMMKKGVFAKRLILKERELLPEPIKVLPKKGAIGVAFTDLRPFGKVLIEEEIYEAETEGEFISTGYKIEVLGVKGIRLVIKEKI